jgi:hypothetical protein
MEKVYYWLEKVSAMNTVISVLTDYRKTEAIMDTFERKFSKEKGF